jgi:hypothetical protein
VVTRKEAALVAEAGRRRGEEEAEEAGVAGVLGSRGSGSSSRAAPASRRAVLLRAPPFSSSSSPSPSPPAAGRWAGDWIPPRRLGLGVPWGSRRWLLIAAVARGYVDGRDAPGGRGARRDGGHDRRGHRFGAGVSQSGKREDDDDDVGVTQGGPHLAVSDGAARGRRAGAGGWLSGPMGRKRPWAEREVGGPLCTVTFPIFPLGYYIGSNLNFNSNLNPHK